jgi:hypothetical protein
MLGRTLLGSLERRRATTRTPADATIIGSSMSLRVVRTALEEIQSGTAPVFVGPWNDSTANELLYWIPFVRWASSAYGIAPERLIVVTNGGSPAWYASIAQRSIDARSLFSAPEIDHWMRRTVPQHEQDYKQAVMSPFDSEIVERAARAFELSDYQVLHPSLVFRVISRLFKDRALERLADVLRYEGRSSDTTSTYPGCRRNSWRSARHSRKRCRIRRTTASFSASWSRRSRRRARSFSLTVRLRRASTFHAAGT